MMQYVHCLHNVHNQSTAICRQIIWVDIEVQRWSRVLNDRVQVPQKTSSTTTDIEKCTRVP